MRDAWDLETESAEVWLAIFRRVFPLELPGLAGRLKSESSNAGMLIRMEVVYGFDVVGLIGFDEERNQADVNGC